MQIYVYNYGFDTTDDSSADSTQEYFYSDVTSFAAKNESIEKKIWIVDGKESSLKSKTIASSLFRIIVPGDAFECAAFLDSTAKSKISAMKQKLREKKKQ